MKYITLVMIFSILLNSCNPAPTQENIFITANQDTYISSANLTDYSNAQHLIISNIKSGEDVFINRVFLNFNYEELPKNIKIDSAFLYVYSLFDENRQSSGNNALIIQRVMQEWSESSVKWREQPKTNEKNEVILPKTSIEFEDYEKIDVSKMVQAMFLNDEKFGFLLKMKNENQNYKAQFFASGNHKDKKLRPALKVIYSQND